MEDVLCFPVYDGGNKGVRRRDLHKLLKSLDFDPLAVAENGCRPGPDKLNLLGESYCPTTIFADRAGAMSNWWAIGDRELSAMAPIIRVRCGIGRG
ncbi:hypothetical protein [Gordonia asplenii]|uniref:hypothetical protein n=1 Tax=Gordonia asplenii TaxID=2725283 RepID=UPI001FE48027|nr:hypothetical protein [Gordonia asplenii]